MENKIDNIEKYINLTRGCVILEDEETICNFASCNKLNVHNWMDTLNSPHQNVNIVEVRFKNTRKDFYKNETEIPLKQGDLVAVEASPGHDIGIVSLVGDLVYLQLKRYDIPLDAPFKKIYRKAREVDIEKWKNSIEKEINLLKKAREIADDLKLEMKIGDVEYQGDGTKAIFYYIADERVDFRELIKIYAEEFRIRIEMRQIGARQEAGRIGGIGACGRELCCTTFITNFVSVTTGSARLQELSLNPQKLAGQCSKLKCCLNYELESYVDALKDFPNTSIQLIIEEGNAFHQKTDVFKGIMWYSFDPEIPINITPVPVERVKYIIEQNKIGKTPKSLLDDNLSSKDIEKNNIKIEDYQNDAGKHNLERFDRNNDKRTNKKRRRKPNPNQKVKSENEAEKSEKKVIPKEKINKNIQSNKPNINKRKKDNRNRQQQNKQSNSENQKKTANE